MEKLKRLTLRDWEQKELAAYLTAPTEALVLKARMTKWDEGIMPHELDLIADLEAEQHADEIEVRLPDGSKRTWHRERRKGRYGEDA